MPVIRTYLPLDGYFPEVKKELYLEANNCSEGEKTYELKISNERGDGEDDIVLTLDMNRDELYSFIRMLKIIMEDE